MVAPFDNRRVAGSKTHNYYTKYFTQSKRLSVKLLSFCEEYDYNEAINDLNKYNIDADLVEIKLDRKSKIKRNIFSIFSKYNPFEKNGNFTRLYFWGEIKKKLYQLKNEGYEPDVIILSWTQIGLFIEKVKTIFPNAKYVCSEYDVSFQGYYRKAELQTGIRRLLWINRSRNLKSSELAMISNSDMVVVQNKKDSDLLQENGIPASKILTIVPYYDDYGKVERNVNWDNPSLIFYGAMKRPENYECAIRFIEKILPQIKHNVKFFVIGGTPDPKLKAYDNNQINVTGFVEDITPYLETCICMVAPLTMGAGIKVKTIEMLAAGVPVVTNKIGIEGIPAVPGKDYIACESDKDFIIAINSILDRKINIDELSSHSKNLVQTRFGLMPSCQNYENKVFLL